MKCPKCKSKNYFIDGACPDCGITHDEKHIMEQCQISFQNGYNLGLEEGKKEGYQEGWDDALNSFDD